MSRLGVLVVPVIGRQTEAESSVCRHSCLSLESQTAPDAGAEGPCGLVA